MTTNRQTQLERELRHHYLFSALSEAQRARILSHVFIRDFGANELLFSQNDPAQAFFILVSGTVKLYRVSADGQEKIMRLIRPGQSFAESIMFMDQPRYPVHGAGVEAGALLVIERGGYLDLLRESFDTCRAVMVQMTHRIQAHWDEIEALTLQNSRYRVVHYLLSLVPKGAHGALTITLPARKMLIAAQLAITPETLSRILRVLSDEGLIEVQEENIRLLDTETLRKRMH